MFGQVEASVQVVGHSLSAASQTVPAGLSLHSLHAYFVRAGKPDSPVVYDVRRVRNGKSFATRYATYIGRSKVSHV